MSLPVGRSTFTEKGLKIHHYDGSLRITDMRNAGKRGMKVSEAHVSLKARSRLQREPANLLLEDAAQFILPLSFDEAVGWFRSSDVFDIETGLHRGIDVAPAATRIELNYKVPYGGVIDLTAEPFEFRVKSSYPLKTKTGEPSGFMNDSLYYNRKKTGAQAFYRWLQANLSRTTGMTMDDYRNLWQSLGVEYDYQ